MLWFSSDPHLSQFVCTFRVRRLFEDAEGLKLGQGKLKILWKVFWRNLEFPVGLPMTRKDGRGRKGAFMVFRKDLIFFDEILRIMSFPLCLHSCNKLINKVKKSTKNVIAALVQSISYIAIYVQSGPTVVRTDYWCTVGWSGYVLYWVNGPKPELVAPQLCCGRVGMRSLTYCNHVCD